MTSGLLSGVMYWSCRALLFLTLTALFQEPNQLDISSISDPTALWFIRVIIVLYLIIELTGIMIAVSLMSLFVELTRPTGVYHYRTLH